MNPEILTSHSDVLVTLLRDWGIQPDILRFAGRVHPMLVHFPIALLIAAAVLEMLRRKGRERPARGAYACLGMAAFFGVAAAAAGWLNAALEPHSRSLATTLTNHRWLGVATASCALLAFLFATLQRFGWAGAATPYRGLLLLAAILVMPTGHLGGTLVFGKDYLFEVLRGSPSSESAESSDAAATVPEPVGDTLSDPPAAVEEEPVDVANASATTDPGLAMWRDEVRPLFASRCFECHGPDKKKGGLRLDRLDGALDPELGVITPGDPDGSYLYELVTKDADDPDLMPADGEPLTPAERDAIRRWIEAGAPHDADSPDAPGPPDEEGASLDGADSSGELAAAATPVSPVRSGPPELGEVAREAFRAVAEAGGAALRLGEDSTDVEVSFSRRGDLAGDPVLESLAGLEPELVALRLDRTAVTDDGVARLERFSRLSRLDLSGTAVGDAAVAALAQLPGLTVVNLYGTAVTDEGVAALADLASLERVFLWESRATSEGIAALREARPDMYVEFGDLATAVASPVVALPDEGATPAPDVAKFTPAPCCAEAVAAGGVCAHPCCVAALAAGEPVCTKCGGVAGS